MKVRIERRGGLVGKRAVGEREDAELTEAQRDALSKLVSAPPAPAPSPGADRFQYRIMVIVEGTKREFDVPENAMPEELACIPKLEP
jgi:hypothetical protein